LEDEAHEGHDHADHDQAHADHEESSFVLTATAAANLGLETTEVRLGTWYDQVKIPGTVHVDWDRQATVSTPTVVRIVKLDAPPHATVRAGQRLAVLELVDPEVRQLQIRAVEARAELLATRTERDRNRTYLDALAAQGASAAQERRRVESDLAVQEARLRSQQSTLEAVLAALEVAGLNAEQRKALEEKGEVATRIQLHAPTLPGSPDLEVAARHVRQGETVEAGSDLYELVALDQLLVWGEAFEADLPTVRRAARDDLPVSLLFSAEGRAVADLRILSVEGALDGEDRVTHFFVRLPNRVISEKKQGGVRYLDWENRAGSRVQVLVATEEVGQRIVIPAAALVREGGSTWAFRRHGDHFDRVEVRVESIDGRSAVLPPDGGLEKGDEVVVVGALQVHLAQKQAAGGGAAAADPHAGHSH